MRHFLQISDWSESELLALLAKAQQYTDRNYQQQQCQLLANKTVALLFFENSTRTRLSFEIAAKRLGAVVVDLRPDVSAVKKGETLIDTVTTIEAMDVDALVIRHEQPNLPTDLAAQLSRAQVMNAGDGARAHPTQALLDMLTIQQAKKDFKQLKIAVVGDIKHSRVVSSSLAAMAVLGVPDVRLVGPKELLPFKTAYDNVALVPDLKEGLQDADVIVGLRVQKERFKNEAVLDEASYIKNFQLTPTSLKAAKPDAIVMHPGPMNRGLEITDEVADGKQSVILQQVSNGVAGRMAVLEKLLNA